MKELRGLYIFRELWTNVRKVINIMRSLVGREWGQTELP